HVLEPPLRDNNWAEIGTHEEACTVFLQRLADPTIPWDAVDNPYITIDFLPMDLTTFNGEEDVRETITRSLGGMATVTEAVDPQSGWDEMRPMDFNLQVRMDTRRKIPNALDDRVSTAVLAANRTEIVNRSTLTMTTNRLRSSLENNSGAGQDAFWTYEIGSMWRDDGTGQAIPVTGPVFVTIPGPGPENRTPIAPDSTYQPSTDGLVLDDVNSWYTQSFGFVNREFGLPTREDANSGVFDIGGPENVYLQALSWMDREFQSPLDLMNVPAVSRTRLLAEFGPGTRLEGTPIRREVPEPFNYLLGFDQPYGLDQQFSHFRANDTAGRLQLGIPQNAEPGVELTQDVLTGERSAFERVFDYVDIGPVWFDTQHWFDPTQVRFRNDNEFSTLPPATVQRYEMFNRSVETLQPPNNYIGLHRTPGKINLNTSPDYIRKGPAANAGSLVTHFLDGFEDTSSAAEDMLWEDPLRPYLARRDTTPLAKDISANPANLPISSDGFTNEFAGSELYANGSVYRSFAWGISNAYDLDTFREIPSTMGENNQYEWTVATPFGRGFKAFIESRRGYSMTTPGVDINGDLVSDLNLLNPTLDYRYPTRFAGLFSVHRGNESPSIQRFMRLENQSHTYRVPNGLNPLSTNHAVDGEPVGLPRRTYDMSLLRMHPDFDRRTYSMNQRDGVGMPADTRFSLNVEADAVDLVDPTITAPPTAANGINDGSQTVSNIGLTHPITVFDPSAAVNNPTTQLRMPIINTGLFERSDAELHGSLLSHDRDSYFRHKNAARLANVTTHHSNVYMIRMTLGYFVVDPETGAVGEEYIRSTGEPIRSRGSYVVDRTIPIGFLQGESIDASRTILYQEVEE
ncbi:MAG: hypothetical protein AAFU85_23985, partial [Planctomycetota bacterium]